MWWRMNSALCDSLKQFDSNSVEARQTLISSSACAHSQFAPCYLRRNHSGGRIWIHDLIGTGLKKTISGMNIRGRVHNGVVVLETPSQLPEGAVVDISYPIAPTPELGSPRRKVRLPLVPSCQPGTRQLTSERIAELLDDDDVPA